MMKVSKIMFFCLCLSGTSFSFAQEPAHMEKMETDIAGKAICILYPTTGNDVSGTVTFIATHDGIRVVADVRGLTPGKHGFHIHEFGDCSASDGSSAGGHFNPGHMQHGAPQDPVRHEGDLGNLVADKRGIAHLDYTDTRLTLSGPYGIIGYSVIVHAKEDDLKSQPTGNAGGRVACGVIGVMK